jgi:hypothetical protein
MFLFWPVALVVLSLQIASHFLFHQLLDQPLNAQTDDTGCDVSFSTQALAQQVVELLANFLT